MLTTDKVRTILFLRDRGVPYRQIAGQEQISTYTVWAVVSGKWAPKRSPQSNSRRCPGCGNKVVGECLACLTRSLTQGAHDATSHTACR